MKGYGRIMVVGMKGEFITILMILEKLKTKKWPFLVTDLKIGKFGLSQKVVKLLQNLPSYKVLSTGTISLSKIFPSL